MSRDSGTNRNRRTSPPMEVHIEVHTERRMQRQRLPSPAVADRIALHNALDQRGRSGATALWHTQQVSYSSANALLQLKLEAIESAWRSLPEIMLRNNPDTDRTMNDTERLITALHRGHDPEVQRIADSLSGAAATIIGEADRVLQNPRLGVRQDAVWNVAIARFHQRRGMLFARIVAVVRATAEVAFHIARSALERAVGELSDAAARLDAFLYSDANPAYPVRDGEYDLSHLHYGAPVAIGARVPDDLFPEALDRIEDPHVREAVDALYRALNAERAAMTQGPSLARAAALVDARNERDRALARLRELTGAMSSDDARRVPHLVRVTFSELGLNAAAGLGLVIPVGYTLCSATFDDVTTGDRIEAIYGVAPLRATGAQLEASVAFVAGEAYALFEPDTTPQQIAESYEGEFVATIGSAALAAANTASNILMRSVRFVARSVNKLIRHVSPISWGTVSGGAWTGEFVGVAASAGGGAALEIVTHYTLLGSPRVISAEELRQQRTSTIGGGSAELTLPPESTEPSAPVAEYQRQLHADLQDLLDKATQDQPDDR